MGIAVIDLFKAEQVSSKKSFAFGKMPYIRRRIESNLARAIDFYHFGGQAVSSSHILAKVINTANNIPLTADVNRYAEMIEEAAYSIFAAEGIGTQASPPKLYYGGDFYGTMEFYITAVFDDARNAPWYEAEPVRVLEHQRTDITFTLLDGRPNTHEQNTAVIGIDLVALMKVYKQWRKWSLRVTPDDPQSIPQFVHNWVLPGMIRSHNDIAFRNLIMARKQGIEPAKTIKRELGIIANSYAFVYDVVDELLERTSGAIIDWPSLLTVVPMLTDVRNNAWAVTRQTDYLYTKYGNFMRMVSCLGWVKLLALLSSPVSNETNAVHITKLNYMFKRYRTERWVGGMVKFMVDREVDEVIATITPA